MLYSWKYGQASYGDCNNQTARAQSCLQNILMDIFVLLDIPYLMRRALSAPPGTLHIPAYVALGNRSSPCWWECCLPPEPHGKDGIQVNFVRTTHLQKLSDWVLAWVASVDEQSGMHPVNPITSELIAFPLEIAMEHARPIFWWCRWKL